MLQTICLYFENLFASYCIDNCGLLYTTVVEENLESLVYTEVYMSASFFLIHMLTQGGTLILY